MKKRIFLLLITIVLLITTCTTTIYATAEIAESNKEDRTVDESEYNITYSDIFKLQEDDYEMNELVDGNAFIIANGDLKITGEINGSAYVIANGTVEIDENAYIADALYVVAKNVKVSGVVYDIYATARNFETTEKAYISRDINVAANNIKLRGTIYRGANISAETINVKDAETKLTIAGKFNYTSDEKEIEGLEEVVTSGEINYIEKDKTEEVIIPSMADKFSKYIRSSITSIVYVLIIFALIKLFAPGFKERVEKDLKEKSIVNLAIGLLGFVIISIAIIITIIMLITVITAPIAIVAWILMILSIYISPAVLQIGILGIFADKYEKIKENIGYSILTLIAISLCISILKLIPVIGGLVSFIVTTTGLGLVVRNAIVLKKKDLDTNIKVD